MSLRSARRISTRSRRLVAVVSALAIGGLLALGVSAPSFADSTVQVTVKVVNRAGTALPSSAVHAIPVDDGVLATGGVPVDATAVKSTPGYFTATLISGQAYTLVIEPTGTAGLSGTWEYLGGGGTLDDATTFVPSASNHFVTATFAAEAAITGKVTSPTGAALKNAEAEAFVYAGGQWEPYSFAYTSSTGVYSLTDLAPGSYVMKFFASNNAYPSVYSGEAQSLATATPVSITPGKTATVNAKFLSFPGSFSGSAQIYYDEYPYPDEQAIATAYPVLTQSGGQALTVDYGHAIASGAVNSHGAWAIANVPAGDYVINIEPAYYNESSQWVGTTTGGSLASATIFSIAAGQKLAVGTTYLNADDNYGAQPSIYVWNANGSDAVSGAEVTLTNDGDGYEYASGISGASYGVPVALTYGDGTAIEGDNLQPGWYTIDVIDPTGAHEPRTIDKYLDFYGTETDFYLPTVTTAPAFSAQPTIAQTDLQVGTTYTVTGQTAARDDAVLTYQWYRGDQPIYNATGTSYTSTGADLGGQLAVRVTASSFGFSPVYSTAEVQGGVETAGAAATNTPGDEPSITPATGSAFVGTTLQAKAGGWSATGLKFHYAWTSNGQSVGSDSATYVVTAADINEPVTVSVTATKTGYDDSLPVAATEAVTPQAHPAAVSTKAPAVTKVTSKGITTYTATAGSWSLTGLSYTYVWTTGPLTDPLTNVVAGPGTSTKLSLPAASATWSDPLELTVIANRLGYLPATKTIIVQKGTEAFTDSGTPPLVHDTESASDLVDSDDQVHVGEHLAITAHADWTIASASSVLPTSYSYQWYRQVPGKALVAIVGATAQSYVVAAADVNQLLSVKETANSTTYAAASAFAVAGFGYTSQALVNAAPAVAIRGVGAQGQVLTAAVGAWPTTGVVTTYAWVDCPTTSTVCTSSNPTTYLPIAKATSASLTVLATYGTVAVRVTGSKAGYAPETEFSGAASLLPAATVATLTAPTVSGTSAGAAHVGVKLTAVTGKFSVTSLVAHYVWQVQACAPGSCDAASWTEGSGAGASTAYYTPSAAEVDASDSIRVEESVTRAGYTATPDDSAAIAIAPGTIAVTKAPIVTATTSTFTASAGTFAPASGSTVVQWYADEIAVGAPNTPYARSAADAGKLISAVVTYSVDGYTDHTTTLIAQRGTLSAATVSVVGFEYGDLLSAAPANPFVDDQGNPVSLTLTYQWYYNGIAIKGAVGSTFRPTTAYIGKKIQVKVAGSSALYNPLIAAPSAALVLGTGGLGDLSAPSISFSGALQPGTVMTSVLGTGYIPTAVTVTRQWQKSTNAGATWVSISKATAATYAPAATDVGAEFRVVVVSSKSGYATQTQYTEAETVLYSPTLATLTPPVVTGTGKVGEVLTATPGTWNTPTLTYSYQWYRDDVLIPGATATTFTPDFTDATDTLSYTVTASRVGYLPVTVTSNDQVVALGTITATVAPKLTLASGKYSVSTGSWAVDGLTLSYQWSLAGTPIANATTESYTPSTADAGLLTVVITATRTGYTPFDLTVTGPTLKATATGTTN